MERKNRKKQPEKKKFKGIILSVIFHFLFLSVSALIFVSVQAAREEAPVHTFRIAFTNRAVPEKTDLPKKQPRKKVKPVTNKAEEIIPEKKKDTCGKNPPPTQIKEKPVEKPKKEKVIVPPPFVMESRIKQIEVTEKKSSFKASVPLGKNQPPDYPEDAKEMGFEGKVLIRATISEYGQCVNLVIMESSGYEILDNEALRAVSTWSFRPAEVNGVPVESEILIPIIFRLDS